MENYINHYTNYLKMLGLANRTIKIYCSIISKFLLKYPEPIVTNKNAIIEFMLQRGQARTIQQTHGALNHFFTGVLNQQSIKKIPQPKVSQYIPNILSQSEIHLVIKSLQNIKHEAILQLMYSCALRLGETLNLKVQDICKTENQLKIISGKGNKTAYLPIPEPTKQ